MSSVPLESWETVQWLWRKGLIMQGILSAVRGEVSALELWLQGCLGWWPVGLHVMGISIIKGNLYKAQGQYSNKPNISYPKKAITWKLSWSMPPLAIPEIFPLHETITSLGSNLSTHCPFNTMYSNPSWDPHTIHAWSPFPIHLIYILPCLVLTLNIN